MSGHSKWSQIKRKKGAADQKRGQMFSKFAKEITVATRLGGGDPNGNPRLRAVLIAARAQNMPSENVERAIKRGLGELPGQSFEESRYEGYGPGGVALLIDCLTDNKKRTVGEIRHILDRNGGSMAESNAVAWNFERKGSIKVSRASCSSDDMFEKAIEAGAEDVDTDADPYEVITAPQDLQTVAEAVQGMGLKIEAAEVVMTPKTTVKVEGKHSATLLKLIEALEDHDDVQHVYTNFDMSEEEMAAAAAASG
ncbi:MAG: YebC/PmpR family DNA-binding transcriptional regulator [Candidatus Hydrogenedentes bacterium]|nr:YebC/PmpR family DNA-binding transcriptional regulator [Candidatus Hydrogenedentota bacterium]